MPRHSGGVDPCKLFCLGGGKILAGFQPEKPETLGFHGDLSLLCFSARLGLLGGGLAVVLDVRSAFLFFLLFDNVFLR